MTNMIPVPKLTLKGIQAAHAFIAVNRNVNDPMDRRIGADEILADPEFCGVAPGGGLIDASARFANAMEYIGAIHRATKHLGNLGILDTGVNAAILLLFIDQVIGKKSRKPDAYFVGNIVSDKVRNYRNGIYVFSTVYEEHLKTPGTLPTTLLLTSPVNVLKGPIEKIAQDQNVLRSPGALDLLSLAFVNGKGRWVRLDKKETGGSDIDTQEAVQELFSSLFTQAAKNFDVAEMAAAQLIPLIPDTPTLLPFKRRAKKALAARGRLERAAA